MSTTTSLATPEAGPSTHAQDFPPAVAASEPTQSTPGDQFGSDHAANDAHQADVTANNLAPGHALRESLTAHAEGREIDALLALAAATLDDIERTRVAMGNRLRAMRDDHGLADTPEYETVEAIHKALAGGEHQAALVLRRTLRRHPLHPWVKGAKGVGEKQAARLLAAIGDPTWNAAEDRPRRGVAEFWQYCGHGDPERSKKRLGKRVQFSPEAKMRAHLIAESCIKHRDSPYRVVYDDARRAWLDRETSDGHKHNHALRVTAKAVLRDLFLSARDVP